MERLYTPWRMKYVSRAHQQKGDECVFCAIQNDDPARDRENFVVYRGQNTFVVMNIFPYNTGHLMVIPKAHVAVLPNISAGVQFEMMSLASYFVQLLAELMHPDGFNIGMNIGRAAGAGIDNHLHLHVVPRWSGDSNFMPVIGETRVLPEELGDTYDKIVARLKEQPPQIPPFTG